MKKLKMLLFLILLPQLLLAQFYNHQWLIGYWPPPFLCGRIEFDSTSYTYSTEVRKMGFEGTQGNICNTNGDFIISSNGVWIANANNDTLLNGSGLNPGYFVNSYPNGSLIPNGNFLIPTPGDTSGYTLFHQTEVNSTSSNCALYYSTIDMNLDVGLGGVLSKNNILINDSLSWGITACKHANGRDWWIIAAKDSSDKIYKLLYTDNGIVSIDSQSLNFYPHAYKNIPQLCFNNEGNLLAFNVYDNPVDRNSFVILCDFDRCTGNFSNTRVISVYSGAYLWGLSFSPSGEYLYTNTSVYIFQINTLNLQVNTVAIYDGFSFPIPAAATTFMDEYLAANGKIDLTSGNGVQHLHEINYPDSAGLACDVQQHAVSLGVWHFRAVPNHPNYNLGPVVGSVCDSITSIAEIKHDFLFSISPNPTSDEYIKLVYLLPQNKAGVFEVYNMTGQLVYKMNLPPWSTLQFVQLPELSNGVYTCVVKSGYDRAAKKLVIVQ
ncbi:MAG: T9SS type A sorting domain-containing protein [Bacteroidetes bacterium]|nr:T9SS type A sorting domain-containing protein [Bacteroidota bacterium]